jgi:hypothetical protein
MAEALASSSTRPTGRRRECLDHWAEALDLVAAGAPIAVMTDEAPASISTRPAGGSRQCLDYRAEALDPVAAGAPIAVTTAEATASSSTKDGKGGRQAVASRSPGQSLAAVPRWLWRRSFRIR